MKTIGNWLRFKGKNGWMLLLALSLGLNACASKMGTSKGEKQQESKVVDCKIPDNLEAHSSISFDNHALDQELQQCLDAAQGDYAERLCYNASLNAWTKHLEALNLEHKALLKGKALSSFEQTQTAWQQYFELSTAETNLRLEGLEGTMYERYKTMQAWQMTRARAKQLERSKAMIEEP